MSELSNGGVTMLRYWSSERTLWLADVFGAPEPLGAAHLSGSVCGATGMDAASDQVRRRKDLEELTTTLGR